jgi:hypothetical protein
VINLRTRLAIDTPILPMRQPPVLVDASFSMKPSYNSPVRNHSSSRTPTMRTLFLAQTIL